MSSPQLQVLAAEYKKRLQINPKYSLRAFARTLNVSPGRLSEVLSGKRRLTEKLAKRFADILGLDLSARTALYANVRKNSRSQQIIDNDVFELIGDWYHYGILSLLETKDFKSDEHWIAERLNISVLEVRDALERLQRLELVNLKDGQWTLNQRGLATKTDIPSGAIRRFHRRHIENSLVCLEEVAVELRDITATTMAINVEKLAEAKKMIRDFRANLSRLLESGDKTEVYNLNVQLVPVVASKRGEK